MQKFALVLLLSIAAPATAKGPAQPPEPAEHPDWNAPAKAAITELTAALFDPNSAEIKWTSGFQWGFTKGLIGSRSFAWIACGTINAKNRMGGYVGPQPFFLAVHPDGSYYMRPGNALFTTCDEKPSSPINPELIAALPSRSTGAEFSIADELKKLAELRDTGVLSVEEFEKEKAKLLAQ